MIAALASAGMGVISGVVSGAQGVKAASVNLKTAQEQTAALRAAFEIEQTKLAQIQAADPAKQARPQQETNKALIYAGIAAGVALLGLIIYLCARTRK